MIYIYEHPSLVIPAVEGGLELCSCGYPAPDKYLRWGDVYVAGALAELELPTRSFCAEYCWGELAAERIVEGALLKGRV